MIQPPRIVPVVICAVQLLCAHGLACEEESPTLGEPVSTFLASYCLDCHGSEDPAASRDLSTLPLAINSPDAAQNWLQVLEQLQAGLMPPLEVDQPDPATRTDVIRSLETAILASGFGEAYRRKVMLPAYGNLVDHDLLFSVKVQAKAFSPARLWRLSPYIFDGRPSVGKVKGRQNPFDFSTPATGLRDFAATSDVGSSVVETILLNADAEIEYQIAQTEAQIANPPKKKGRPNPLAPFLHEDAVITDEQKEAVISSTFQRVVSRTATPAEMSKYIGFLERNLSETSDPRRSLKATLTAIYLSPEAIYRMEWGLGPTDEFGRRMLSPQEIAQSLSYALFDHGPFAGGRSENRKIIARALEEGKLNTADEVAAVVTEIMRTETYPPIGGQARNNMPRVLRFFREFFGYHLAADVFKDARRVNEHGLYHSPRRLVADADNLIKTILRTDQDVFERMLTTNEALVLHDGNNQRLIDRHEAEIRTLRAYDEEQVRKEIERRKAGVLKKPKYKANPKLVPPAFARIDREGKNLLAEKKARLARLEKDGVSLGNIKFRDYKYIRAYNLSTRDWKWPAAQPFALPAKERAGILTHPAWLAAHSVNDGNDPVHRGIWVYERLLAGVIGDVPPSVDARIPTDPHKTLRQRMEFLRDDACWKCHHKINPLGEAFEVYDDFGRYRTRHFFDENGNLVTRSARHVLNEDGKEVVEPIDREQLVSEGRYSTKPVNARGSFDEVRIPGLSGEFENAVEMLHAIAATDRARQSIIRHLFRFFMGRNETLSDAQTLIDADRAYVDNQGSFRAVVVSLLSSDSFLYRK